MANLNTKKVLFTAAFMSKLLFGILFAIASYFIQSDLEHQDMEKVIKICGGEDWYFHGKRIWYEESELETYRYGYVPWDENVVNCIHKARSGLIIAGAVFLFLFTILEAKALQKSNGKLPLLISLIQSLGGLLIVSAAVSDLATLYTRRKVFRANDYEAIFLTGYNDLSRTLWIAGFVLLLLGQLYNIFQHRHSGILVLSTYIVAGIGTILLLVAGILRRNTVYGHSIFLENDNMINQIFNFDDQVITDISALMLSGSVIFIAHALMFFSFLYNEVVSITEEKDLSHEEIVMEEGHNPNTPLDIEEDKVEITAS